MSKSYDKAVIFWLLSVSFLVFLMVFIGGVTRLTDSGLSIVEWKPISGIIPPLNLQEWNLEFDAYKKYPEYQLINNGMSLSDFKFIYFWEYFHRLMGRLVGLVFFIPFIYFLIKKRITGYKFKLTLALILGAAQGFLGWYMVKSGLVERPDVSHFRLAAHLSLAFIIIGYLFWIVFDMTLKNSNTSLGFRYKRSLYLLFALICIQIVYGAFVAGLDAGIGYNTWPLMDGSILPRAAYKAGTFFHNIFYNQAAIQFIHRTMAIFILVLSSFLFFKSKSKEIKMIFHCIIFQFVIGVVTLLAKVPVSLGSLHQVMACILFLLTIRAIYIFSRKTTV